MNKDYDDASISLFEKSLFYINKHTLSGRFVCILSFYKEINLQNLQINSILFK